MADEKGIGARLKESMGNVKGAGKRVKESFSSKQGAKDMLRRMGGSMAAGGAGGALGAGIGSTMKMADMKERAKKKPKVPGTDRPDQTYSND